MAKKSKKDRLREKVMRLIDGIQPHVPFADYIREKVKSDAGSDRDVLYEVFMEGYKYGRRYAPDDATGDK